MNSRATLFLVVLVAIVGGFVVWDHYRGITTEQHETRKKRILEFESKDITGIDLVRSNQTIGLVKSGDNWDIRQPLATRADAGAVNSILDELEFAERLRTLSEAELKGVNLADFGLAEPRYRVTLHSAKRPVSLLVGGETPTKDALYAQIEGHKDVYVTRKSVEERLSLNLDGLRSRMAIEFAPAAATRIEISRALELSKSVPGWTITRPLAARADPSKVSELLSDLSTLRIQDFVSEEPKDVHTYFPDEPERELTVFTGDSGKTLVFGKPLTNDASKVYAKLKAGNSIFTVSADAAKKLAVQINDLRDPRVLAFSAPDVHGIEIVREAGKIVATRTEKGWELTAPTALPADDPSVAHFLDDLANLRAKEFVADVATDLDKYGLAAPTTTVTLLGEGTNVVTQLLIGGLDANGTLRYAKNAGEPFIYGLEPDSTNRLPDSYGIFRTRRVYDLKPEQVTKVVAGNVTTSRDPQGKWQLVAPAQGALDVDGVQHLVETFCQLRAQEFLKPGQTVEGATIQVTVGEVTHRLVVAPDGRATADGCELNFKLAPPVVQTLMRELVAKPASAP